METLQDRIRWILDQRGWGQNELSRRAKLAPAHVTLILNNLGSGIHGKTIVKLARAAGVSVGWLQSGEGSPELSDLPTDDPFPDRAAVLDLFRRVDDPDVQRAVTRVQLKKNLEAENLNLEGWVRALIWEVDRIRRTKTDPAQIDAENLADLEAYKRAREEMRKTPHPDGPSQNPDDSPKTT